MPFQSWTLDRVLIIVIELVCILFAVMLHEIAHGYAAYRLGDPTAKRAGRLTLNPAKHLDPVGSVLLPALMAVAGLPIFAWAKPVPYNPYYFKNRRAGELIVAFAGPLSNLAQALVGALMCFLVVKAYPSSSGFGSEVLYWTYQFGCLYCLINLVLMFFNIIPLPPLDGASIVALFLNERGLEVFYQVKRYSMVILLVLLVLIPRVTGFDPLGWYFDHTAYALFNVLVP